MHRPMIKLFVSGIWPLCVHLIFLAVEMASGRMPSSSLKFAAAMLLAAMCLWHFLSRSVLPIAEICCKHTATYDRAHVVSLYRRKDILYFPWRHHADIRLSSEKTGCTWIGMLDPSICKDARVRITFCKRSRYILFIEAV